METRKYQLKYQIRLVCSIYGFAIPEMEDYEESLPKKEVRIAFLSSIFANFKFVQFAAITKESNKVARIFKLTILELSSGISKIYCFWYVKGPFFSLGREYIRNFRCLNENCESGMSLECLNFCHI